MGHLKTQEGALRGTRINRILAENPLCVPMTSEWLASRRVSPQLLQGYKSSGWLSPLGRGVWIRAGTEPTLSGSLYALQRERPAVVYPAACTALGYQGRLHSLPLGASPVLQLGVGSNRSLPQWFTRQPFAKNLRTFNAGALFDPVSEGLADWHAGEFSLEISSPERAMLEYCYLLPNHADFEEAKQLMEGLATLRPDLVQSTLRACKSLKQSGCFSPWPKLSVMSGTGNWTSNPSSSVPEAAMS